MYRQLRKRAFRATVALALCLGLVFPMASPALAATAKAPAAAVPDLRDILESPWSVQAWTSPAPTGVSAVSLDGTTVRLSWDPVPDAAGLNMYVVIFYDAAGGVIGTQGTAAGQCYTQFMPATLLSTPVYTAAVTTLYADGSMGATSGRVFAALSVAGSSDTTPPPAVTGLAAGRTPTSLTLVWDRTADASGIVGYLVQYSPTADYSSAAVQPVPADAGTAEGPFSTGMVPGASDHYRVAAVDNAGNVGPWTEGVSSVDSEQPSAVTGLTGTPVADGVDLTWNRATDNVAVAGYEVQYATAADFSSPSTATAGEADGTAGSPFRVTGLGDGTTGWYFRVRACDAAGNAGAWSGTVSSAPMPAADTTPPEVVTGLEAVPATSVVVLSWNRATDDRGVVGYAVQYSLTADFAAHTDLAASEVDGTDKLPFEVPGLEPSTDYYFRIAAKDAAGNAGLWSESGAVRTLALPDTTPPAAVTGVAAVEGPAGTVRLTWAAATDDTGVTGYEAQMATAADFADAVTREGIPAESLAEDFAGLAGGTTYRFRVRALDAAGNAGAWSEPVPVATEPVLDTTPPSAVAGVEASATARGTIAVAWAAATDDTGIAGYEVQTARSADFTDATTRDGIGGDATSTEFTGLDDTTPYYFRVRALDAAGNAGPWSPAAAATTPEPPADTTPPTAPASLVATAGELSVRLSWAAATDDTGIAGYRVRYSLDPDMDPLVGTVEATAGATAATVEGLLAGSPYYFRVEAYDAAGNATSSDTASATPLPDTTPPAKPTGLQVEMGNGKAVLSWAAIGDAKAYEVQYSEFEDFSEATTLSVAGTSTTVTGLANGTPYYFRVRALDASGNAGAWSTADSGTPTAVPTLPRTGLVPLSWPALAGGLLLLLAGAAFLLARRRHEG